MFQVVNFPVVLGVFGDPVHDFGLKLALMSGGVSFLMAFSTRAISNGVNRSERYDPGLQVLAMSCKCLISSALVLVLSTVFMVWAFLS